MNVVIQRYVPQLGVMIKDSKVHSRRAARFRDIAGGVARVPGQRPLSGSLRAAAIALSCLSAGLLGPSAASANGGTVALDDPARISRLAVTIHKSETIRVVGTGNKCLRERPPEADRL